MRLITRQYGRDHMHLPVPLTLVCSVSLVSSSSHHSEGHPCSGLYMGEEGKHHYIRYAHRREGGWSTYILHHLRTVRTRLHLHVASLWVHCIHLLTIDYLHTGCCNDAEMIARLTYLVLSAEHLICSS